MGTVLGIDAAFSRIDRDTFSRFYADGYRIFIQDLWTGGYANNAGLRAVARDNLYDAKAAGLTIAGYVNANPWWGPIRSLNEAKLNAGDMWAELDVVAVDAEIDDLSLKNITDIAEELEREGKRVCIYTAHWVWDKLGQPVWEELARWPLWIAQYDNEADLATAKPFGPWTTVMGKQYGGDKSAYGVEVDFNVFDARFFEGDDMGVTEEQVKQWIDDASKATNARIDMLLGTVNYTITDLKHTVRLLSLLLEKDYPGIEQYIADQGLALGK